LLQKQTQSLKSFIQHGSKISPERPYDLELAKKYVNFGAKPWNQPNSIKVNSCVNLKDYIQTQEKASTILLPDLPAHKTIPKIQKKRRYGQKRDMMVGERMQGLNASVEHFNKDSLDPNGGKPKLQDATVSRAYVKYNL
jgi:hypothetical protein